MLPKQYSNILERFEKKEFVETESGLLPGLKLEMLVSNKICVCVCVCAYVCE